MAKRLDIHVLRREISENAGGISTRDLATTFGCTIEDQSFQDALTILKRKGNIKEAIGRAKDGSVAIIIWPIGKEYEERLGAEDEESDDG